VNISFARPRPSRLVAFAFLLTAALFIPSASAAISSINSPGTSNASIIFDDTNSIAPPAGTTNTGPSVSPWSGATLILPLTTDPNTFDFATGNISGTFAGNNYAININNVQLNQQPTNTGNARLTYTFDIEYQLDAAGLPSQPTLFPNFLVNGTVQPSAGSFAKLSGFINYSGVNTAGTYSVLETVNYANFWNTPGPFSATAFGVPVNGFTPALVPNTTLTLNGQLTFLVDPASINATSVQSPEPATLGMVVLALGALGRWRR